MLSGDSRRFLYQVSGGQEEPWSCLGKSIRNNRNSGHPVTSGDFDLPLVLLLLCTFFHRLQMHWGLGPTWNWIWGHYSERLLSYYGTRVAEILYIVVGVVNDVTQSR